MIVLLLALVLLLTGTPTGSDHMLGGPAIGLNCGRERWAGPRKCKAAGARIARVEFSIADTPRTMERLVKAYAAKDIKLQPLAGFHGRLPSATEARNLRAWALRFGPRSMFWKGRSDRRLAITRIEFGNETSYGSQYGDTPTDASYAQRARDYALRARDAASALDGTGVGLLLQGDDGGSTSTVWLDEMFAAVPNLDDLAVGWTIHPYGPSGYARIDKMVGQLRGEGASRSLRIFVTEWGLATDNGRTLSDNYGYPTNMTYPQAAAVLASVIADWNKRYGSMLTQVLLYQISDQARPGASSSRESYFGVLRYDGTEKSGYTAEVRKLTSGQSG